MLRGLASGSMCERSTTDLKGEERPLSPTPSSARRRVSRFCADRSAGGRVAGAAAHRPARAVGAEGRAWTAWVTDCRGVTAVEFALLAVPVVLLMCVILEAGILTLSQQTFDAAVGQAGRLLRTGGFQDAADGSDPVVRLRKVLCGGPIVMFRCEDVRFDLSRGSTFATTALAQPYDDKAKSWAASFGTRFDCPQGNDVVALRAAVPIPRLFGFLDLTKRSMGGALQMMVSTAIVRAEPYSGKTCQ